MTTTWLSGSAPEWFGLPMLSDVGLRLARGNALGRLMCNELRGHPEDPADLISALTVIEREQHWRTTRHLVEAAGFERRTLDMIRSTLDLGAVIGREIALHDRSWWLVGNCPFCDDDDQSLHVGPADYFSCTSCAGRGLLATRAPGDPRRLGLSPSQQVARAGRILAPGRARPEAVRTRTGPRPAPRTGTCLLWSLSDYRALTASAPGPHRFG